MIVGEAHAQARLVGGQARAALADQQRWLIGRRQLPALFTTLTLQVLRNFSGTGIAVSLLLVPVVDEPSEVELSGVGGVLMTTFVSAALAICGALLAVFLTDRIGRVRLLGGTTLLDMSVNISIAVIMGTQLSRAERLTTPAAWAIAGLFIVLDVNAFGFFLCVCLCMHSRLFLLCPRHRHHNTQKTNKHTNSSSSTPASRPSRGCSPPSPFRWRRARSACRRR